MPSLPREGWEGEKERGEGGSPLWEGGDSGHASWRRERHHRKLPSMRMDRHYVNNTEDEKKNTEDESGWASEGGREGAAKGDKTEWVPPSWNP